jgi:hypothetical protein
MQRPILGDNLTVVVHERHQAAMEYRRQSHGLLTFLEHGGLLIYAVVVSLASKFFFSLAGMHGASWLGLCAMGFAAQIAGAVLIGYAKLPLYRNGCSFTFGIKSIPLPRVGHYRWGWRLFLIGVCLSLSLLLGRL